MSWAARWADLTPPFADTRTRRISTRRVLPASNNGMNMLVTTPWLAQALGRNGAGDAAPDIAILDASLHLPGAGRDAGQEFAQGHIPCARFLDLAGLHDPQSSLPGKIPDAPKLRERLALLGVGPQMQVVLYDDSDLHSACRAWYLLTLHGLRGACVLDGGLAKWRAEGRPLEEGAQPLPSPGTPPPLAPDRARIRSKAEMLDNLALHEEQVVDARDAARFRGENADTVHGLPGGHIPGAKNLPFTQLFRGDGTFLPVPELAQRFREAEIDPDRRVVTTCGSGVTASVLMFALALIGARQAGLYDGSWSEWGADPATPKEQGLGH
ncbi:3-mercaptopyruvate sulfurtransferase [Altererythrobacter sp. MTPC7]